MGKTKRMADGLPEPTEEQNNLEEGKTKQVEMVAITPELGQALLTYLGTRPYQEVQNLIHSLSQSPKFNATVGPAPAN